jgi:Iodothyronine deiodinase
LERLYEEYQEKVEFFIIYIKEAHPVDGRASVTNERLGILIQDPKTYDERVKVAAEACVKLETKIPCLVDGIENTANAAYAAWPDRLYLVAKDGTIAVAGGQGPKGFSPAMEQAAAWLAQNVK